MITETAAFKLGIDLSKQLYKKLVSIKGKKKDELDQLTDILNNDPLDLVKYYIEPNCQEINPADRHEEDHLVSREPVFKKINEFIKAKNLDQTGNKHMFILSDAGMGKTSLLIMLKLMHLSHFWKNKEWVLKVLGPDTLPEIETIEKKRDTIMLLDALDEDPEAFGRVQSRLLDILKATKKFFRVIITCRTQYFPEVETEPFERPGQIIVGTYPCPAKYLSLFNDEKIELYLKKRFPGGDKDKREKAKEIIGKMGSLKFRPMLLSYIEQLMESPVIGMDQGEYKIYNALVLSWLIREEEKSEKSRHELLKACEILARQLSVKGAKEISGVELDRLIKEISELETVKSIDIKGRSLLNLNSYGNYRFAHQCIQEFLVTKSIIEDPNQILETKLPMTPLIAQMLIANSMFKRCHGYFDFDINIFKRLSIQGPDILDELPGDRVLKGANFKGIDIQGKQLKGADLEGADLQAAKLKAVNLGNANLDKTNLLGANLQDARLQGASFKEADLSWVNLKRADLEGADLKGANLYGAVLHGTNLSGADLTGTILNKADLQGAKFNGLNLFEAVLNGAILQGVNFRGIEIKGADLSRADFRGADFREASFIEAKFEESDFSWADLQGADFQGATFQYARFECTDLRKANLKNVDLRGAALHETIFQEADLSGVKNISVEMLLNARTIFRVKGLNPKIEEELRQIKPELFEELV
jgi:uncharacterized protein YjbI with pentapeptide repeats